MNSVLKIGLFRARLNGLLAASINYLQIDAIIDKLAKNQKKLDFFYNNLTLKRIECITYVFLAIIDKIFQIDPPSKKKALVTQLSKKTMCRSAQKWKGQYMRVIEIVLWPGTDCTLRPGELIRFGRDYRAVRVRATWKIRESLQSPGQKTLGRRLDDLPSIRISASDRLHVPGPTHPQAPNIEHKRRYKKHDPAKNRARTFDASSISEFLGGVPGTRKSFDRYFWFESIQFVSAFDSRCPRRVARPDETGRVRRFTASS